MRYEFGAKVSIAATIAEGFIVRARSLPGNQYDGHTLQEALDQVEILTDIRPSLAASGCDNVTVLHKPRLLSDNGPCYIADDLAKYLGKHGLEHVRGAPNHPQTQCKIERWHQLSRTASFWKTIIWRANLKPPSPPVSSITTTTVTTRASAI